MEYNDRQKACIRMLQARAAELGRVPQREDFPNETMCRIKNMLGPWPRALETAGLKQFHRAEQVQKTTEKRVRGKRRRTSKKREWERNDGCD